MNTILRRFQRMYQHLQQKNPTAQIAIAGILPRRRNKWYAVFTKEEAKKLQQQNETAKIVNWRLSELSTTIAGLSFISWPEFPDVCDHLLARDGLHTCQEGTYIVAKKFRRVCRELAAIPRVSAPTKSTTVPTNDCVSYASVLSSVCVDIGASVRSESTSNSVPTKSTSTVSVPTKACGASVRSESTSNSVHTKSTSTVSVPTKACGASVRSESTSNSVPTKSTSTVSVPTKACGASVRSESTSNSVPTKSTSTVSVPTKACGASVRSESTSNSVHTKSTSTVSVPTKASCASVRSESASNSVHTKSTSTVSVPTKASGASVRSDSASNSVHTKSTSTVSVPTKASGASVRSESTSNSVHTKSTSNASVPTKASGASVRSESTSNSVHTKSTSTVSVPTKASGASVRTESTSNSVHTKSTSTVSVPTKASGASVRSESASNFVHTKSTSTVSVPTKACGASVRSESASNSVHTKSTSNVSVPTKASGTSVCSESTSNSVHTKSTSNASVPTKASVAFVRSESTSNSVHTKSTSNVSVPTRASGASVRSESTSNSVHTKSTSNASVPTKSKIVLKAVFKACRRHKPYENVMFNRSGKNSVSCRRIDIVSATVRDVIYELLMCVEKCANKNVNESCSDLDVGTQMSNCVGNTNNFIFPQYDIVNNVMNDMLSVVACNIDGANADDVVDCYDNDVVDDDDDNDDDDYVVAAADDDDVVADDDVVVVVADDYDDVVDDDDVVVVADDYDDVVDDDDDDDDDDDFNDNDDDDDVFDDDYVFDDDDGVYKNVEIPKLYGGGTENKVYMLSDKLLQPQKAREIIENLDESKVMFVPPLKPKGGEVYVFSHGGDVKKSKDWRADKYIWVNRGGQGVPKNSKSFWHLSYNISMSAGDRKGDTRFTKHVYFFKDKPDWHYFLIHYRGDESVFVPRPHGLSVANTRPHKMTCPSVLTEVKTKVLQNSAGQVYSENINNGNTDTVHQGILNVRDKRQVKNCTTAQRKKYRVSHDEIFGALQLALHVKDFVKAISIFPDIRVVLGSKDIWSELNSVLTLKSDEPVLLCYDTTFNVGDFFVSVLVFRHVLFKNGVTIPAAFLIHDRKNQSTHDEFFRIIAEEVPNLNKGNHVIVTDREKAFTRALDKHLPNMKQVFCWNHLRRDLRHWLSTSTKNATSFDKSEYGKHLVNLMQCESIEAFEDLEAEYKLVWSQPVVEYFDAQLCNDIIEHAARWVLEECNVYDPYSGVTNNMSEGTNIVIEGLKNYFVHELSPELQVQRNIKREVK